MTVTKASEVPLPLMSPERSLSSSVDPALMIRPSMGEVTSVFSMEASMEAISLSLRAMLYSASRMSALRASIWRV